MSEIPVPMAVIRYAKGKVDDVAISGDLFRLEQMSNQCWWTAIYRGDKRVAFFLRWDKKSRSIIATVSEDEIGCIDDSEVGAQK